MFNASHDASMVLGGGADKSSNAPLRVATTHEVFLLKSLVITERAKTRDYFDLYTLLKKHEANLMDAKAMFSRSWTINGWSAFTERLSRLPVRKDDEGYRQMMINGEDQPSLDDMREFFRDRINAINVAATPEYMLPNGTEKPEPLLANEVRFAGTEKGPDDNATRNTDDTATAT